MMDGEVDNFSKMVDTVFCGLPSPLVIPSRIKDREDFLNQVFEKQKRCLIVRVKMGDYTENEVTTKDMFVQAFLDALIDVCDDEDILKYVSEIYCNGEILNFEKSYNLLKDLPEMIIDSSDEYSKMIIVFDDYFNFRYKMENDIFLHYLFKNHLLDDSIRHVCYILSGEFDLFFKRHFKTTIEYLEDEDILAFKIKRPYEKSKTAILGWRESLEFDEFRLPAGFKISYVSKILKISKKAIKNLFNPCLKITFENDKMFLRCRFSVMDNGVEKEFNYILNDKDIYFKKDSIVFDFDGF